MDTSYTNPSFPNSKSIVSESVRSNKVRSVSYPCQISSPNVGYSLLANSPSFFEPRHPLHSSVSLSIIHLLNVGGSKHNTSTSSSNTGTRNIKCFKCLGRGHIASECPTRRTMIMKADGEITSESKISEEEVEEEE